MYMYTYVLTCTFKIKLGLQVVHECSIVMHCSLDECKG